MVEPASIDAELAFLEELAAGSDAAPAADGAAAGPSVPEAKPGPAPAAPEAAAPKPEMDDAMSFLFELAGTTPEAEAAAKALEDTAKAAEAKATEQAKEEAAAEAETSGAAGAEAEAVKAEPEAEAGGKEEEAAEETYERDATELLGAFKDAKEETDAEAKSTAELMQDFLADMRAVDRDNEVCRILWAFKLNPFEKMNLRFDSTESEVRKQYRKISLLIHPDKCSHASAPAAFEVLGKAQKELLNEEVRESLMRVLEYARDLVREERRKATKHDSALRLAATLHEKGREGVEADWEKTDDFHEKWRMQSRDVLAKSEFRRRKLNVRLKEEEVRIVAGEKEDAQARKKQRLDKKEWLDKRGDRIHSWRDWNVNTKKTKKTGGIKAPKLKTADTDKSYVQRNATEQFVGNYKKKAPK